MSVQGRFVHKEVLLMGHGDMALGQCAKHLGCRGWLLCPPRPEATFVLTLGCTWLCAVTKTRSLEKHAHK
eukprot:1158048-Pelagomonas_calceolata.AAC.16